MAEGSVMMMVVLVCSTLHVLPGMHRAIAAASHGPGEAEPVWTRKGAAWPGSGSNSPSVTVGPFQTVFNHSSQACNENDFPDTSARAFRDRDGNIQIIAVNSLSSHRLISTMLNPDNATMVRDCHQPLMTSGFNADPSQFDDQLWIQAVYTADGKTIHAIVHDEFHGERHNVSGLCPTHIMDDCWYCTLLGAVSYDAGKTFQLHPLEERIVAALPQTYPQGMGHRVGLAQNTGIVRNPNDGMFYFMALRSQSLYGNKTSKEETAPDGMCVFRTNNVSDPTSWYAWDGAGYNAKMVNPYTLQKSGGDPNQHICHIIPQRDNSLRFSLYFSTFYNKFMLVGTCHCDLSSPSTPQCVPEGIGKHAHMHSHTNHERYRDPAHPTQAFCFALSDNLITWSDPFYIMNVTSIQTWSTHHSDGTSGQWYPALVDATQPGYNLDRVGESAYLFFVYFHPKVKDYGKSRDLWRASVKFSK